MRGGSSVAAAFTSRKKKENDAGMQSTWGKGLFERVPKRG